MGGEGNAWLLRGTSQVTDAHGLTPTEAPACHGSDQRPDLESVFSHSLFVPSSSSSFSFCLDEKLLFPQRMENTWILECTELQSPSASFLGTKSCLELSEAKRPALTRTYRYAGDRQRETRP